jgi:hypothetical protein
MPVPVAATVLCCDAYLIVNDDIQQSGMNLDFAVVFDQAKLAEFVHEEVILDRVVPTLAARAS